MEESIEMGTNDEVCVSPTRDDRTTRRIDYESARPKKLFVVIPDGGV